MAASKATPVYGIFEGCIGVDEDSLPQLIHYFEFQGYEPCGEGRLGAEQAQALYSVDSSLRSIRLRHRGGADHGLIRSVGRLISCAHKSIAQNTPPFDMNSLLVWNKPVSRGLGTRGLATRGSRWLTSLTHNLLGIADHAEIASDTERDIRYVPPMWIVIYEPAGGNKAFQKRLVGAREMLIFRPLTRQTFFQVCTYYLAMTCADDSALGV